MKTDLDWDALGLSPVPETCQREGCARAVETWCPLCNLFLCADHDQLTPQRMHDCLSGPADD